MSASFIKFETQINEILQPNKQPAAAVSSDQQQGLKRPISDDLNLQPAKKQYSNGSEMAGMVMGSSVASAGGMEIMEVPENAVGLVIGRGGEQITSIQSQSGCRVQLAPDGTGMGFRPCTLTGPPHAIERARQLITEIVNRSRANAANGSGMGGTGGGNGQFITQQLLIPGNKCGLIIGKNGETIKNMQESLGVKMLLIQENQASGAMPKPLRITGPQDKVEQAKRAVETLLSNDENNRMGGGGAGNPMAQVVMPQQRSMGEVIVPRSSVGIIIGKGGETIKRLAAESGTKIQFKQDDNPSAPERCAVIQGTPSQIERATNLIWDLVQRSNGSTQQEVCLMHVPANKTGLVIGKAGDTIKAINNETGAHVELSRDPPPNATEKVFVIKGSPYQIHLAQHAIRIKVGDIPPGTPAPAFQQQGGAGFQPQFAAPTNQYNPQPQQQQWAAPANGFVQNTQYAPTNQFYGQQPAGVMGGQSQFAAQVPTQMSAAAPQQYSAPMGGQYQQQQSAAAVQPQNPVQEQSVNSQPAVNPSTGQVDYSAQWIEYYRSVGLHDQAAMIEEQIRNSRRT